MDELAVWMQKWSETSLANPNPTFFPPMTHKASLPLLCLWMVSPTDLISQSDAGAMMFHLMFPLFDLTGGPAVAGDRMFLDISGVITFKGFLSLRECCYLSVTHHCDSLSTHSTLPAHSSSPFFCAQSIALRVDPVLLRSLMTLHFHSHSRTFSVSTDFYSSFLRCRASTLHFNRNTVHVETNK